MPGNPFDELDQLFDRMEAQFEGRAGIGGGSIAVDVLDQDDAFEVRADLPGFAAEDLDLTYAEGQLRLSAERQADETADYVTRERPTSVERRVSVPGTVDADAIGANFEDGVLTVTLPKEDPDDAGRRIEIE